MTIGYELVKEDNSKTYKTLKEALLAAGRCASDCVSCMCDDSEDHNSQLEFTFTYDDKVEVGLSIKEVAKRVRDYMNWGIECTVHAFNYKNVMVGSFTG